MERNRSWTDASDGSDSLTQANVEMEQHGGVSIARIRGDIDTSNVDNIEMALQTAAPVSGPGLVVDLTGVDYLNSAAIKMFFALSEELGARGLQLRVVVDESAPIRKVLAMIHFERLVPLHQTVKEAWDQIMASRGKADGLPSSDTVST